MTEPIESAGIADLINKFFNWIMKDFDTSEKKDVTDKEGNIVGSSCTITTAQGHKIHVKYVKAPERKDRFNLYMVSDTNHKQQSSLITKDQINNEIAKFIDKVYEEPDSPEDSGELERDFDISQEFDDNGVVSSSRLQIQASRNLETGEFKLHKIFANYDPLLAYEDLETVLEGLDDSDEIVIAEEPISLEIIPFEDEYDINPIDTVEEMNIYQCVSELIKRQTELLIEIEASYNDFRLKFSNECYDHRDYFKSILEDQKEFLLETRLSKNDCIDIIEIYKSIDYDSIIHGYEDFDSKLENYACLIDLYYPNFDHEIQRLLDEWLLAIRYYQVC